jgi:hypothetical protein
VSVVTLQRPRKPLPKPAAMVEACEIFGIPMPAPWESVGFTLSRSGHGTIIGLCQGGHWWNLSALEGEFYPPSFKAARQWIAAYAARYGTDLREMRYNRARHDWVFK